MSLPELEARILAGNRRALGRAISLTENDSPLSELLIRALYARTGTAYAVGVTGPPGAGKSTVVDEMLRVIREQNTSVAVLAVDPNSPFTGGAILGDRVRMMRHSSDPGVFIRSMGARGHLGGLAVAARNTSLVLDAAGFEIIILETVGVGQSELEVAEAADTTIVVIPPGLGDGVQAIKAGIMEVADIFAVNKADNPNAERTIADIRELLRMDPAPGLWRPPIVKTVATQAQGVEDLWLRVQQHRRHLESSGELVVRRRLRLEREIRYIAERRLRESVIIPRLQSAQFGALLADVMARRMDPYEAAERVITPDALASEKRRPE